MTRPTPRKPPRTRGAKPRPEPAPGEPTTLKPERVEGVLIAARVNEKGEKVGEEQVASIKLYAPNFDKLPGAVEDVWPDVLAELERLDAAKAAAPANGGAKSRPRQR